MRQSRNSASRYENVFLPEIPDIHLCKENISRDIILRNNLNSVERETRRVMSCNKEQSLLKITMYFLIKEETHRSRLLRT